MPCDVFSFGMVVLEIHTCDLPYAEVPDMLINARIAAGQVSVCVGTDSDRKNISPVLLIKGFSEVFRKITFSFMYGPRIAVILYVPLYLSSFV